ncbi:ABC transporter permease subunit [Paenibacillus sp. FSL H8-0537]|uniref:ABC transporter permease n=1 Tax=Paenibacillus sp. FSL H8-0537 TaxID=2921399 RepID=UPI003100E7B5
MYNFSKLLLNENMKIYLRTRTWIMTGLLLALVVFMTVPVYFMSKDSATSMWTLVKYESAVGYLLIAMFTAVVAAGSVAEEFTSGTIKLLLIRPWMRWKILLSKYISVVLFALFQVVLLYAFTIAFNFLFFDSTNVTAGEIHGFFMDEGQYEGSAAVYNMKYYAMRFIALLVTSMIAFMLSTVFRSGGLAIGLSIFLVFSSISVGPFIGLINYEWVDYLFFVQLDLVPYLVGDVGGRTLGFAISVLAVYYALFAALTWFVFEKRDVGA